MKFALAMLALAVSAVLVGCDSPEPTDAADQTPAAVVAYPVDAKLRPAPISASTEVSPGMTSSSTPTATPYVPAVNPTPIAKPTGCKDYGYAGRAADGDPTIDTYWLTNPPDSQADAAFALAQTLCIAGGRYVPDGEVRFKKADYSLRQLQDWSRDLNKITWSIEGVYTSGVREGVNRIWYRVKTPLGAERLTELIKAAGVPLEAVIIEQLPLANIAEPPPQPWAEPDLTLALEFEEEIPSGQSGTFAVSLKNHDFRWLRVVYNPQYPVDLIIYSDDGAQVWRDDARWGFAGADSLLWPYRTLSFHVEWPGTDDDKLPLEPGLYWVRAFFELTQGGSEDRMVEMSTYPVPLQVLAP